MRTEGAIFVIISHKERVSGLIRQTRQMAYLSPQTEDIVMSREAMETLRLVANLDDSASVRLVSKSLDPGQEEVAMDDRGSSPHVSRQFERPGQESSVERHRSAGPGRPEPGGGSAAAARSTQSTQSTSFAPEYIEEAPGGQLTLDLLAVHNSESDVKVKLSDLKPSKDPDFVCRGTLPLKNGFLTCGCYVRGEAPDALTHKDVPGFGNLSNEGLRRLIIKRYIKSGFNNCRIQPLKMMYTDKPL